MNFLDFEECDVTGHLNAIGDKGHYFIMNEDKVYLELVNPTPAGPEVKKLGTFHTVGDAEATANLHDTAVIKDA